MKKVVFVFLVLVVAAGGVVLFRYRHGLFGPDFDRVGGTEIVFQVADDEKEARLDEVCDVLTRWLDPSKLAGVVVQPEGERRVAVRVPNGKAHDDVVEFVKLAAWHTGRLEFCIVANEVDDAAGIAAARDTLRAAGKDELARLEKQAIPPPGPQREGKRTFPVKMPDEPAHSYRWVEVGKFQLFTLRLNSDALEKNEAVRDRVNRAIDAHEAFDQGNNLYFARNISDWTRRNPRDRELGKTREFFVLMREPRPGQEITGDYLVRASAGHDQRGRLAIDFVFNTDGGERFHDLTSRNQPSGGDETGFKRQLAIIFDGQVSSAPSLLSPIRSRGQITGEFTQTEIDNMVRVLRAGALPVRLLPVPVSERTIEPQR
jgi:preprotein translocase subunit SecD